MWGDEKVKENPQQPIMQMVINFNPNNGQIQVSGPIANRGLSYLMLELARDVIYEFKDKEKPQIHTPCSPKDVMDLIGRRN